MYLFLTEPRLRGAAVKRLQEMLSFCGYDIGEWGADGIFGEDTLRAVVRYQSTKPHLLKKGVVTESTWYALEKDVQTVSQLHTREIIHPSGSGCVVDIRKEHIKPKLYRFHRSPRSWSKIEGVTLHQTGCNLADKPKRWYSLNAHIGVLKDGTILLVNDPTDFIWHAQGFSHNTIGIEFNGNFWGDGSDISTWWAAGGEASFLTPEQKKASKTLLRWLELQFAKNDATFSKVYAHRQASKDRRADPGSEIWRSVAMPWMRELGATDGGPEFTYGSGRPIPKNWDPSYFHSY